MERFFRFREFGTTYRRETLAGLTTFLTLAYIIIVNPAILSFAGIPAGPSTARGLGQPPRPAPDTPTAGQEYPVYGPPPGLGPPMGRQRPGGGPGYPGLRGPGTGYPKHRQYANPPRYPSPAPQD